MHRNMGNRDILAPASCKTYWLTLGKEHVAQVKHADMPV